MFPKSYSTAFNDAYDQDNQTSGEKRLNCTEEKNNNNNEPNEKNKCKTSEKSQDVFLLKERNLNKNNVLNNKDKIKPHTNHAFDKTSYGNSSNDSDSFSLTSSCNSLVSGDNKVYNTVLCIEEDVPVLSLSENDGTTVSNKSREFEEEDTVSLLADGENRNTNPHKRDSKHFIEAVERRLSLTQDAGEKIVHKILDGHFERYEEIPKEEIIEDNKQKKSKRVLKKGQILSTVPNDQDVIIYSKNKRGCCYCCGTKAKFITGIICILIGILTTIWTPSEILMRERLRMTPGLPAFDWWAVPPDDIYLRVNLFNYTNWERFLSGEDKKLDLQEIGPVVFKEKLQHSNFTFNANDTLTYRAHRWVEFLPDLNTHIDMNATIVVPNMPILGFASYLYDTHYFARKGFDLLVGGMNSQIFVNITIYDYLFNFTDPILETGRRFLPQIVPISNMGMLSTMYMQPIDTVTVFIGPKWGDEKFFTIDHYDGSTQLPGFLYTPSCKETVSGSTEGVLYRQRSTKNTTLLYWRKTLCKVMALYFEDELTVNGILAYKFAIPETAYHRTFNHSNPDCFAGEPPMIDGLSDVSKCFFDFPMALSLPHFLGTDPKATEKINGLSPNMSIHSSYLIVEPMAGIPIVSIARSQINLVIRKISGFNRNIQKFSDMTIPMFWAEYSQVVLPDYIWNLMIAQLKYLPVIQVIFSVFMILLGLYLTYAFFKQIVYPLCCPKSFRQHKNLNNLARNTILSYEQDKKPDA